MFLSVVSQLEGCFGSEAYIKFFTVRQIPNLGNHIPCIKPPSHFLFQGGLRGFFRAIPALHEKGFATSAGDG